MGEKLRNAEEFIRNVETAKFSSDNKRDKLAAFRSQLAEANNGTEVSDDQLFEFLRHLHTLSYDLDVKSGVVLSLLHSVMNQYSMDNVRAIWTQVIDEVQTANKNAGTLTKENLPHDLRSALQSQPYATIPETYAPAELGNGDQILLIRKYSPEQPLFLLYPTYNYYNSKQGKSRSI